MDSALTPGAQPPFIIEVSAEVCSRIGGIYTVIRSKVPSMISMSNGRYCLIGMYYAKNSSDILEPVNDYQDIIGQTVLHLRSNGFDIHYGKWLIPGMPKVILINLQSIIQRLGDLKQNFAQQYTLSFPDDASPLNKSLLLGYAVEFFLTKLTELTPASTDIVGYFHEYIASAALLSIKHKGIRVATVFTTHATKLGRNLAATDNHFYTKLPYYDWQEEVQRLDPVTAGICRLERLLAHCADVFATVSETAADECKYILGRQPDLVLPNGLNTCEYLPDKINADEHQFYNRAIRSAVEKHFNLYYKINLHNTLFFFSSGRFEYKNKGFDILIESLARVNDWLRRAGPGLTVVVFFFTEPPADVTSATRFTNVLTHLNRLLFNKLPGTYTHHPSIFRFNSLSMDLKRVGLVNYSFDRVKILVHPGFLDPSSPFVKLTYNQFIKGCHLGIFPSFYEPWGYTPLECVLSGTPAVTSSLSGWGKYVLENITAPQAMGVHLLDRNDLHFNQHIDLLTSFLLGFIKTSERIDGRQKINVEEAQEKFDWKTLIVHYKQACVLALARLKARLT